MRAAALVIVKERSGKYTPLRVSCIKTTVSSEAYFLVGQNCLFLNSTEPTKRLDKNENNNVAEPELLESESSSDSDGKPEISNVMHTKTVILLDNYFECFE